jgi:hypothetical protein
MNMSTSLHLLVVAALIAPIGCMAARHGAPPLAPLPFSADTVRSEIVADGVVHRFIYSAKGPWAINVLDVDLGKCNAIQAVKGVPGAAGRVKATDALASLQQRGAVAGGVNADFFSLTAPFGVPVGALVIDGTLIAGPGPQSVLAFDSAGVPRIAMLRVDGAVSIGQRRTEIDHWNRAAPAGVAFFDAAWGARTDSATGAIEVVLAGRSPSRVVAVDTLTAGVPISRDGGVLVVGRSAPAASRSAMLMLRPGDSVRVSVSLAPFHPYQAVGGRPAILRDSVIGGGVDTEGQASFNVGRNPRTAAAIASNGRRLLLVVVDGREMPYSDGMSLRELAVLMQALGARDAINLDGGGSSTLVAANPATGGTLQIANRPSDKVGERAVGDALAIVHRCR